MACIIFFRYCFVVASVFYWFYCFMVTCMVLLCMDIVTRLGCRYARAEIEIQINMLQEAFVIWK